MLHMYWLGAWDRQQWAIPEARHTTKCQSFNSSSPCPAIGCTPHAIIRWSGVVMFGLACVAFLIPRTPPRDSLRWFEQSSPEYNYLRWRKDWHLSVFLNGFPSHKTAGPFYDCQRLAGGFCPTPTKFFPAPRAVQKMRLQHLLDEREKQLLQMSMEARQDERVSATSGPIDFLRSRSSPGVKKRTRTGKTALGSKTLKRDESGADVVEIKCPANTVLLRSGEGRQGSSAS